MGEEGEGELHPRVEEQVDEVGQTHLGGDKVSGLKKFNSSVKEIPVIPDTSHYVAACPVL